MDDGNELNNSEIMMMLYDFVQEWLDGLCDELAVTAGKAYEAGGLFALGQLGVGVSFDMLQKDAIAYAEKYREGLIQRGEIDVSSVEYGSNGMPSLNTDGTVKRVEKTIRWIGAEEESIASDIADIIAEGISSGKSTGVHQLPDGTYEVGSIAADLDAYLDGYRSRATTIARTETARHYYHGELSRYADAGVGYVQYLAAPDACDECLQYVGRVYALGTEPPLPIHPNCRCDYKPYYPNGVSADEDEIIIPDGWKDEAVPVVEEKYPMNEYGEIDMSKCSTLKEVETAIRDGYGQTLVKFDIDIAKDIDLKLVQTQFTHMGRVLKDFAFNKKLLAGIKIDKTGANSAFASCGPRYWDSPNAVLYYNKESVGKTLDKINETYQIGVENGYFPSGTSARDTMTHEFGHLVEWKINALRTLKFDKSNVFHHLEIKEKQRKSNWKKPEAIYEGLVYRDEGHKYATDILIRAAQRYIDEFGNPITDVNDSEYRRGLKHTISKYGTYYGDYETMAEAFNQYYSNLDTCPPYARMIVEESIKQLRDAMSYADGELSKLRRYLVKLGTMSIDEIEEHLDRERDSIGL